ncbi:hypothetical protein [Flavobacterium silvaticum]|uniref:Uncharacterized protein n=1 Tax=Flavobacterium silvaticum TaxID=1852020 RepID=A0A972JGV8_9FLAO|nr:hypothetical protein [Flavobacterium silvaticum]NMH28601.1 hypothetical protein [Flavobacterium silvaticum]
MTIQSIAQELNKRSIDYNIGELQTLRKTIKGLAKKPTSDIFNHQTINENWAFHVGGRSELQFNIGFENEGLRFGFAFSLEPSQSLPNLDILFPKILKLNSAITDNPKRFKKYKMWNWSFEGRSSILDVKPIPQDIVKTGNFIFIGKILSTQQINYDDILKTFDDLLEIYLEVESNSPEIINLSSISKPTQYFVFNNAKRNLPQSTTYTSLERKINVDARHSFIQEKLIDELSSLFGKDAVAAENYIGGKKIDVVLKLNDNDHIFYEIKTANSARACIRQAIGQLLEYSYFKCNKMASKIVVVGEYKIDTETKKYLKYLKNEFSIPIDYKSVN